MLSPHCAEIQVNEFAGVTFECSEEHLMPDGSCGLQYGKQVLTTFDFQDVDKSGSLSVLLAFIAAFIALGYVCLNRLRKRSS